MTVSPWECGLPGCTCESALRLSRGDVFPNGPWVPLGVLARALYPVSSICGYHRDANGVKQGPTTC